MSIRNYEKRLSNLYYSPKGYFKGLSDSLVKKWSIKQTIWQIYLPKPKYIPRPSFNIKSINNEVTRMIGKKPVDAVKEDVVKRGEMKYKRPVGLREKRLDSDVKVRFLYADGELEGGVRRATDPDWSLKVYNIDRVVVDEGEPVLYYLKSDSVKRGFVREELMVGPVGTELPP